MKNIFILIIAALLAPSAYSQITIMPLGESTTQVSPAYRKYFYDLAQADGLNIDMIGPNSDGTGLSYDSDNAGFHGFPCSQLITKIQTFTEYLPDIVLLLEGTNDCGHLYDDYYPPIVDGHVVTPIDQLSLLVDEICLKYPNALVFVSSIPPMGDNAYVEAGTPAGVAKANAEIYNDEMPAMVAAKASSGKKVYFVDARSLSISTDILADGIHPNTVGYEKIGSFFYNAVKPSFANSGVSLPESALLTIGDTTILIPVCLPAGSVQAVTWSSSSSSATVSAEGVVTGVSFGTAIITATSRIDISESASCTVTVTEITALNNIREQEMVIYPNPVTDYRISIKPGNNIEGKIFLSLYNILGHQVYSTEVTYAPSVSVSLPQYLLRGLYFLKVKNGSYTVIKKIIIG
jgi:lysophospholipase L1-like esterase